MKYKITKEYFVPGTGKIISIEFNKPLLEKDINLLGTKINGQLIIAVDLKGVGENCYHKEAELLIRKVENG